MTKFLSLFLSLILIAGLATTRVTADEVLQVKSTSGSKLRSLINGDPKKAKANIMLLVGGSGLLKISGKGEIKKKSDNFVLRIRKDLAAKGYLTALVDAPVDRRKKPQLLGGFRASKEHAADLEKIAIKLKKMNGKPVIALGTSRGTVSAANVGVRSKSNFIKAIILTSSLVKPNKKGANISDLNLSSLKIPMLLIHNKSDKCSTTLLKDLTPITNRLKKRNIPFDLVVVDSKKSAGDKCLGKSPHGFFGIEGEIISKIDDWINSKI